MLAAEEVGDDATADACFARQVALVPDMHRTLTEIAARPARSDAGERGKARVMLTRVRYELDGSPCTDDALAYSICQDILAGTPA